MLNILSINARISSRRIKQLIAILLDIAIAFSSTVIAFALRLEVWPTEISYQLLLVTIISFCIFLPVFFALGLYRTIFRYSGLSALLTLNKAIIIYAVVFVFVFTIYQVNGVPRLVGILQPLIFYIAILGSRMAARYFIERLISFRAQESSRKVLIYGAGSAGRQLATALNQSREMFVVGYLDDDEHLHGRTINGKVVFNPRDLEKILKKYQATHILLAIPSASRVRRSQIHNQLKLYSINVLTLPSLIDLSHGKIKVSDLRDLDVEDLLGRDPVNPIPELLSKNITNKVVLVTGAGGSIGSELCRQIIKLHPAKLILFENNEFSLYSIEQELQAAKVNGLLAEFEIVPLLGSILDTRKVELVFKSFMPQTIYHAAAFKHVPLVECNPVEGLKNNIWGALNVANASLQINAENFVLISTDKAVRPTNIMGASKRIAEMGLQALNDKALEGGRVTRFSMVRFGNVLGSSGSVVSLFRKQIASGGPITLTHKNITRYFMTVSESAQLVIQASAMASGGDVFVLDMGESVQIYNLACKMIELSGLTVCDDHNPNGDIKIEITGLRPGEKLFEELLIGSNPQPTQHPRIFKEHEGWLTYEDYHRILSCLSDAMNQNNISSVRKYIHELVSGYDSSTAVVDWISNQGSPKWFA
jgi:FlaA1/EpsC-like NDP-sugar epimerase